MKVSIITVTLNSESTISRCINSVYKQSHPDIEHIIIDGASKDNTIGIIESIPNRVARIVSEPDRGIYDAMNKGISLATGEIIGMLNSDDQLFNEDVINKIVQCFLRERVDCIFGNLVYCDERGKINRTWNSRPFKTGLFERSWTPAHPTFYCKRELYKNFGLYKTDYKIAADVELMLRFLEVHKISSGFINETFVIMLSGGISNQGIRSTITITKEMKRAFKENGLRLNLIKYFICKILKMKEFL